MGFMDRFKQKELQKELDKTNEILKNISKELSIEEIQKILKKLNDNLQIKSIDKEIKTSVGTNQVPEGEESIGISSYTIKSKDFKISDNEVSFSIINKLLDNEVSFSIANKVLDRSKTGDMAKKQPNEPKDLLKNELHIYTNDNKITTEMLKIANKITKEIQIQIFKDNKIKNNINIDGR